MLLNRMTSDRVSWNERYPPQTHSISQDGSSVLESFLGSSNRHTLYRVIQRLDMRLKCVDTEIFKLAARRRQIFQNQIIARKLLGGNIYFQTASFSQAATTRSQYAFMYLPWFEELTSATIVLHAANIWATLN
jgi:hypothetical protein